VEGELYNNPLELDRWADGFFASTNNRLECDALNSLSIGYSFRPQISVHANMG
jgi:hypothetical protein